jgi:hypothetical protein
VGLWQTIRGWFIREDDPSFAEEQEPTVSSVQYPRPDTLADGPAHETAEDEQEGDGFR